ncbi:C-5 cytosine-specific DNA methylase [Lobulomyces angularis]|nr:C-5 cytosine-specific DNA methylase [Lobulomyces angularis]
MKNEHHIRALEFFSGVGGLHYALNLATKNYSSSQVIASYDINQWANQCYELNFNSKPIISGIEYQTIAQLEKFEANCWLLSPPCQPFTTNGSRKDHLDERSKGLLHLIDTLKLIKKTPSYIFLENVPNFEKSTMRNKLIETLINLNYEVNEFLMSPLVFGIPNDRKRYYVCAKLKDFKFHPQFFEFDYEKNEKIGIEIKKTYNKDTKSLSYYLEPLTQEQLKFYQVPNDFITKRTNFRFDIVKAEDKRCSTFTKDEVNYEDTSTITNLGLRFFTPLEISRLHYFPVKEDEKKFFVEETKNYFEFPLNLSLKQKYQLLGNSLNVKVVAELMIRFLF